ncbi:MAG: M48 family metallopeptidase [Lachnospiraceae bacterium]|nr:M48 family metallopeptidase [Lachnospiraceae bacterium]
MKTLVLLIFAFSFLWKSGLILLKARSVRNPLPENVKDVYDEETYQKWKAYLGERVRFSLVTEAVTFAIELVLLILNLHAAFAGLFPENWWMQMFAVALLEAASGLPMIPFSYYSTMHIEEKYGFNRSSKKTFWADQVKEFVIGLVIMVAIASALGGLHLWLGDWVIVAFAIAMFVMILLIGFLFPYLSRIFNKFTPLEDGELKEKLTALLESHGFKVRAVQVMDASRRTTKSNAYFAGFGKMKTIVLFDTLVASMSPDEICAVFAHELGHGLHKDTLKNQVLTFVQMAVIALLAWWVLRTPAFFTEFGFLMIGESCVNYGFAVLLIMSVLLALVMPLWSLLVNWHSRRAEYAADAQAVKEGYGESLVSALKKLSRENLSDLSPSPLLVKLEYSHPTLSQRIAAIEACQKRQA